MMTIEKSDISIVLVGDSDIMRWPSECLPNAGGTPCVVSGRGGLTLTEILPYVDNALKGSSDVAHSSILPCMVVCAGENDIGNGLNLDETLVSFTKLLNLLQSTPHHHLIFLGPKLEPWLNDDPKSRKIYVKLSKAMKKASERHPNKNMIWFIDCLTMFCGETGNLPGAVLGGLAKAKPQYFSDDQLHLSQLGYMIWKQEVEKCIESIKFQKGLRHENVHCH